ncbi:MAG: ferrous iron transport protein B [Lentisphaerae bacterium]|nr:ferrous iron transport protein B [Lentisphaerota bacterium]
MFRIAVAGNPNSGKTCLFNQMTGSNQRVGNYPGVTVEFIKGYADFSNEKVEIVDLPGTYSLTAYSQEEIVARDFIVNERPDVIVNVVDASNLERNLYLTTQLLELHVPMVIALNMIDVAEKKGHTIDAEKLSAILGIPVIPTIASRNKGLDKLEEACLQTIKDKTLPKAVTYTHELQHVLPELTEIVCGYSELCGNFPPRWAAVKLLEDDEVLLAKMKELKSTENLEKAVQAAKAKINAHSNEDSNTAVVEARYGFAAGAAKEVTHMSDVSKRMLTDHIDRVVCNRVLGPLILCAVVYLLFEFVFTCAEGNWIPTSITFESFTSPVGVLESLFEWLSALTTAHVTTPWLQSLLSDGIIGSVGSVMGFVPLIFFMFLFIAILEDSGYIARVAFIMDRILRIFGLQGKSILAMIVSGGLGAGGCAVPGVMATRTLREEKDRLITILVAPFMNCGAKMPVYAMLIAAFFASHRGLMMFSLWLISWAFALCCSFCLRKFLIKGEQTPFVMELPVYHVPTFKGLLMDTWHRTYMFIKKAATIILAISIIMWALMYYPRLNTSSLDKEITTATQTLRAETAKTAYAPLFAETELDKTIKAAANPGAETVQTGIEKQRKEFVKQLEAYKAGENPATPSSVIAFNKYNEQRDQKENAFAEKQLVYSFAGRLGKSLAPVSKLAGFSWRENIALIGGFAAKEVVLGTMGTAYSLGRDSVDEPEPLAKIIQHDPSWNKLRAFVFLIFIMAYAPCIVTLVAIKKETGKWRWAIFSTAYSTTLAFIVATIIYQVGLLFYK